jgi:hypothetical protein
VANISLTHKILVAYTSCVKNNTLSKDEAKRKNRPADGEVNKPYDRLKNDNWNDR